MSGIGIVLLVELKSKAPWLRPYYTFTLARETREIARWIFRLWGWRLQTAKKPCRFLMRGSYGSGRASGVDVEADRKIQIRPADTVR
jgi:hypothetical protein